MDTKEINKKENKTIKFIIISILVTAVISLIGVAFARYITKINGSTTADIAKWSFKVNGKTNENLLIDLANTRAGVVQEAEVQEGYIGPGTAGRFVIELDATGSDVSLKYDINLNVDYSNNEVFPKNLIFYEDSTMQNAIYHTDNNINLNGFIGWDDNSQVQTKTIYWKWSYETGSTQTEKDNNDIADSFWMGKPISLSMNVTAKQVNENPTAGQYAVTLDANGGTIQGYGNSNKATKVVTYGNTYGNLPTPTREGYEFKGWNGKNLFDENSILMAIPGAEYKNDHYEFSAVSANGAYGEITGSQYRGDKQMNIPYKENTQYTLTIRGSSEYIESKSRYVFLYYGFFYTDGTKSMGSVASEKTYRLTSAANKTIESISFSYGIPGKAYIEFIQLEEGTLSTAYEPYYITESAEVVQNQNHTLTAIWEPIN